MPTPARPRPSVHALVLCAGFLAVCFAPLLAQVLGGGGGAATTENRRLAERPSLQLTARGLAEYPARFERYYADTFGLRQELLGAYVHLRYSLFGLSSTDRVVVGNDGWLFLTMQESLEDFRGVRPFGAEELEAWQRLLEARQAWATAEGARYAFVIPPSKHSVYPEHVPARFDRVGPGRLDQLLAHLRARSSVRVVDLREALQEAKAAAPEQLLYWRSDSHWTDLGALVGARSLLAQVSDLVPGVQPPAAGVFEVSQRDTPTGGDLAGMLGLPAAFAERVPVVAARTPCARRAPDLVLQRPEGSTRGPLEHPAVVTTCEREGLPRAVLFGDSFSLALAPLLAEQFGRLTFVRAGHVDEDVVRQERPALVLELMTERYLMMGTQAPPFGHAPAVPAPAVAQPPVVQN